MLGFRRCIVSATTPFTIDDMAALRADVPSVVRQQVPGYESQYTRCGWRMFPIIDRVYVNERARVELGWKPKHDFQSIIDRLKVGEEMRSPLARLVGAKGYHPETFAEGPYPVE